MVPQEVLGVSAETLWTLLLPLSQLSRHHSGNDGPNARGWTSKSCAQPGSPWPCATGSPVGTVRLWPWTRVPGLPAGTFSDGLHRTRGPLVPPVIHCLSFGPGDTGASSVVPSLWLSSQQHMGSWGHRSAPVCNYSPQPQSGSLQACVQALPSPRPGKLPSWSSAVSYLAAAVICM